MKLSARSGLNMVFVGLESVEPETLKSVKITPKLRHGQEVDFRRTAEAVRRIKAHGIMVAGFFVLGFDTDTRETFDRTLEFCDSIGVVQIPFLLMPLPGTPLWEDYEGRLLPGVGWDRWDAVHAIYEHPAIGVKEREELLYRLRRTSYTAGRILRRLKGLTPGTAFFSLMMQLGLKRSIESDWKRVSMDARI